VKLNPSLPLSDPYQARLAAQAILRNQFDMKRAVAELRPDIRQWRAFGARMLAEPIIQDKIEVIMTRQDRNAQKFVAMNWEVWEKLHAKLIANEKPERELLEGGLNANRVLAKGYINEKKPADAPLRPYYVEGQDEWLYNMTGLEIDKPKKM
jgi:hypothetical protein